VTTHGRLGVLLGCLPPKAKKINVASIPTPESKSKLITIYTQGFFPSPRKYVTLFGSRLQFTVYNLCLFQINQEGFRVVAFIHGNRLHVSEVAATNSNESIVRFLGYIDNSEQDCPDTEILATNIMPGHMEFKVTTKTPDGQSISIPGTLCFTFRLMKCIPFTDFL